MKRFSSHDRPDIALIIAEHERENAMTIDLSVKYDLAKRVYEAAFGTMDYTDVICVWAGDQKNWLPTNEDGWMVIRSGYRKNKKSIPKIDLMSNPVDPDSSEGIFYRELTDEVARHFEMEKADYEANTATYVEHYPIVYDALRNVKMPEQLAEKFPQYLDVLEFYLTEEGADPVVDPAPVEPEPKPKPPKPPKIKPTKA